MLDIAFYKERRVVFESIMFIGMCSLNPDSGLNTASLYSI